jgi:hypothetical protein
MIFISRGCDLPTVGHTGEYDNLIKIKISGLDTSDADFFILVNKKNEIDKNASFLCPSSLDRV